MKYIKFTIKNYKGIPKIELDLNKQPQTNIFTLVGLNESGKTSILEAINRFFTDLPKDQAYLLIPKSKQHSFDGFVSIQAELELSEDDRKEIKKFLKEKYKFELTEEDKTIKIEKRYNFNKSRPTEEKWLETYWTTSFIGKTKQSRKTKKLIDWNKDVWNELTTFIKTDLLPKILYYPDFLFKFPEKIYLKEYVGEGKEQAEYRSIVQDILGSIQDNLTLEENLLEKMNNSSDASNKAALEQLLLKMSSKLNEDILKKWDEIFGKSQKKEVDIKWGSDKSQDAIPIDRYFIELKIKQGSDTYSINDRSLGFRWFFSFLIFTAFRKARLTDPGETLFLLDEPASNLHQRSQQKLLQSLDDIVSDCKLIYSTHSHHLINPKWLAGAYIVRNKAVNYSNEESSNITETLIEAELYKHFVASYPNEEDHFKPILDALDYVPSKLELVPNIVFTEGKNDYYTFKYIYEVVLKKKGLNFYPGAGKDKYDGIFRLYIAWNRKFLAIFDADDGGKKAKKRYENDIGPDAEDIIFCLDNINSSWKDLETENLFTESEKIKIIQKVFPEHKKEDGSSKSKFNTAIQQFYIDKEKFEFNKVTIEKFEKIFNFISDKFSKSS